MNCSRANSRSVREASPSSAGLVASGTTDSRDYYSASTSTSDEFKELSAFQYPRGLFLFVHCKVLFLNSKQAVKGSAFRTVSAFHFRDAFGHLLAVNTANHHLCRNLSRRDCVVDDPLHLFRLPELNNRVRRIANQDRPAQIFLR